VKDKRKSVQIDIAIKYESKSNGESIDTSSKSLAKSIDEIAKSNSIDEESTSSSKDELRNKKRAKKDAKGKRKRGGTVTARAILKAKRRKALDEEIGKNGHGLMKRWVCDVVCPANNRSHHCWTPYEVDGKHFPLNTDYISQWNKEIPLQATIEEPSDALKGRLYAIAMTTENKQKKPRKGLDSNQKLAKGDSQETPSPAASLTPAQTLSPTAAMTMQAPGLYEAYGAPSTMYNAYPHASSIYQQAGQPP